MTIDKLPAVARLIDIALEEDIGYGDITSVATVSASCYADGTLITKARGVVAGLPIAEAVFLRVDPVLGFEGLVDDGDMVEAGTGIARVAGRARSILAAERVALNFLRHLSGVATATRSLCALIADTKATLVDTRKTTPGMRALEKYAVRMGGGKNHRFNLADGVLIKDNHIAAAGSLAAAVRAAREAIPHTMRIEVEARSISQVLEALESGADIIMFDNMSCEDMRDAVALVDGRALTEASGSISEKNIVGVARTVVDLISCGAITHSAPALDISLELAAR